MKLLKGINNALGIAFVAISIIYWFDLDDKMIAKSEPLLKKLAALKAIQKSM